MNLKTLELNKFDVYYIKEIASMKDEEYLNIQSNNRQITFSKINTTSFKTYTMNKKDLGLFNLRVSSGIILSIIKEGILSIGIDTNVTMAMSLNMDRYENGNFEYVTTFPQQDGKDESLNRLISLTRMLTPDNGLAVSSPEVLGILNSLAKVSKNGVLFKDSMIYTDGPGYKAYTRTDFLKLEMAIGVEALDRIVKISKKNQDQGIILWDLDNYLFVKEDTLIHGFKKTRSDQSLGIEALDSLTSVVEFQADLTDIVRQLKGLTINKASSHKVEYCLETHFFTVEDPGRMVIRTRVPATVSKKLKIKFDIKILKDTLTAIWNKNSTVFSVEVYDNVAVFKSLQGVHLIVGRE